MQFKTIRELFGLLSIEDVRLYFNDCLLQTVIPGDKYPVLRFWQDVDTSNNELGYKLFDFMSKESIFVRSKDLKISLWFPTEGWYSFRRTAIHLTRNTARQNHKGICRDSMSYVNMWNLMNHICHGHLETKVKAPFSFQLNSNFLYTLLTDKHRHFSFYQASEHILSGKMIGRSLSPQFALSSGLKSEFPTVWFNHIPVAEADLQGNKVVMLEPLLTQECIDFFSPQGIEVVN